ncbi:5-formyltetrahydrofolate cyclo-ligase [Litoreibacter arenae]|uniref:5-formyltetrahydrofolate cyclo-ligase n=1 Tax=Litoreibacter arenae DSM 19593 TaxID=1123360 RepID=S9QIC7_9RHOB|nr:5-formyltetrahydrofolate cyclo-ligase [Litoreibacter arenae]EPX81206.1 5-formyltetrahydrofolate cyclo-ligase [Litoreibacter arenae DSM 19593]
MSDLTEVKTLARKAAFARREAVKTPQRDAAAAEHLLKAVLPHKGRPLSGFLPIRTEIDPVPVMAAMAAWGPVCVPVIKGKGQPLEFHRWEPGCEMVDGGFGTFVPAKADVVVPQVLIVPLLAFDRAGGRLGYGGGFYDRTLEQLRKTREVIAIGYAFAAQETQDLPLEATDQPLDLIVTDEGVLQPQDNRPRSAI